MHESTQLNGTSPPRPPPPDCWRATAQRNWHQSIQCKFYAHKTERTGTIVYSPSTEFLHAVAGEARHYIQIVLH